METVDPALIRRIKLKMQQPARKQQVKSLLLNLTRADLQSHVKVKQTIAALSHILAEPIKPAEAEKLAQWIIAKRINPANKLQLLRLWSLFA